MRGIIMEKVNVEKILKNIKVKTSQVAYEGVVISVKNKITLGEVSAFAENVSNACFSEDGTYMPELFSVAYFGNLLAFYTDIDVPESIDDMYEITSNSDFMNKIIEVIDGYQLTMIENGIRDRISYLCDSKAYMIEKEFNKSMMSILSIIDEITKIFKDTSPDTFGEVFKSIMEDKKE